MASRPIVCTRARLRVFTPGRHLATQGETSCTKQVVLRPCELGWIWDFPLAGRSCEPCDIPTGFFPWPGVTASRKAGNGSFSLTKHQGRYQLVLIVAFFVLWPEPELNPPKTEHRLLATVFLAVLDLMQQPGRSALVLPRHGHRVLYLHQTLYFSWLPSGLWEETFTGQTCKSPILSCI